MKRTAPEVEVVIARHRALNSKDAELMAELSDPDVEVGGPRGSGRGVRLLGEWVDRANIRLEPLRIFHRTDTVVVEQEAWWRSAETGEMTGHQTVASVLVVQRGRVASVVRYPDLARALGSANLDASHQVITGQI